MLGAARVAISSTPIAGGGCRPGVKAWSWDDFDRVDGAIGVSGSGHTWQQLNQTASAGGSRVRAVISGKKLIAPDAPVHATNNPSGVTAAYSVLDLGRLVTKIRARISFGPGADGGNMTMAITKTLTLGSPSYITTDGALHWVWKSTSLDIGFFPAGGGSQQFLTGFNYSDMAKDGTEYEVGADLEDDTVIFYGPDGTTTTRTDPRFADLAGQYATWEHFWLALPSQNCRSTIHRIAAN
ncbi:hypothetical protein SAMN05428969_3411 [Devosia sp. YR412]|uniref:hypothetical protein n=1 Tax=Devosia sp. YR412 TaxID=1881030 RepID=UPI0008AB8F38|nr:hypothetical protein [Devosia sp. YR412]SEQ53409.1 hypothetical protein SAMN05428969_3411 [Devosia sp. YR412]